MQAVPNASVTQLLDRYNGGQEGAFSELIAAVYGDLRQIARGQMQRKFNRQVLDGLTYQPTEIVHEAVLRLADQYTEYQNRGQFFAIATKLVVRQILDYQRRRMADKRGAGKRGVALDADQFVAHEGGVSAEIEFSEVVQTLERESPRAAEVAVLRLIGGQAMPQIADLLGISVATAERDWFFAKTFLKSHYREDGDE